MERSFGRRIEESKMFGIRISMVASGRQTLGRTSKDHTAVTSIGGRLQMLHLGNSSNNIWDSTSNGERSRVRVGVKILANPTRFTINRMVNNMRAVYANREIVTVEVAARQRLALPALRALDVGFCRDGDTIAEQRQLLSNQDGLRRKDIAIYMVRATVPALNGCAAHPSNIPACVVAARLRNGLWARGWACSGAQTCK